ncbi:MAG: hypothetical protein ABH834_06120 [Candidatus Altiarchaeota archaeon]
MGVQAKIGVGGRDPESINDVLHALFWKDPELAGKAGDFLEYVKSWSRTETPYRVSQWESYCEKSGLTQSQYHNILRRLRRAGLIDKKYSKQACDHHLFLSGRFSSQLGALASIWDEFTTL